MHFMHIITGRINTVSRQVFSIVCPLALAASHCSRIGLLSVCSSCTTTAESSAFVPLVRHDRAVLSEASTPMWR